MKKITYIGIDPAFRENGLGFVEKRDDEIIFRKMSINELLTNIEKGIYKHCVVGIENSDMQTFKFKLDATIKYCQRKGLKGRRRDAVIAESMARVGKNQATSQIIVDKLKFNCIKVVEISPKEKGSKEGKDWYEEVIRLRKWKANKKRTNQDDRDALKVLIRTMGKIPNRKFLEAYLKQ